MLDDGVNPLVQAAGEAWNSGTTQVYGDDTWRTYSISFIASAADAGKTITIYNASQGTTIHKYGWVDNVVLSYEVPEPATMAILLTGMVGLVLKKRRNA